MIKKIIFTIVLFGIINLGYGQANLNNYKYVIIPNKFDFLKREDQYQLNSLTKFLFEKEGFMAIMQDDTYPKDMASNRCLALNSNVVSSSGMFKTKLQVVLKDCNGKVVYETKVGETREKDYEKAHQLSLRDAFSSFEDVNYLYEPNETVIASEETSSEAAEEEVAKLKEEIKALKAENSVDAAKAVETVVATTVATTAIVKEPEVKVVGKPVEESKTEVSNLLYAQAIDDGFQLVDSTPKVVYKIRKTGLSNVYLVEGHNAILYKNGEEWILEYYEGNVLKKEQLPIKF